MYENKEELKLGAMIKSLLKEQSLSMRKLSMLTGIDTSTISRIINGKQPANINHLQKIAQHLHVPMENLLIAAGYDLGNLEQESNSTPDILIDNIKEMLKSSNVFDEKDITEHIEEELDKYEQYVLTEEGIEMIHKNFDEKINNVSGIGPFIEELKEMYEQFCMEDITSHKRVILGSGLLYFIISTDVIPDYIFPIGYLDDIIAIKLVSNRLEKIS
jgi:transcriptional regulator with XRE-family HTH domain